MPFWFGKKHNSGLKFRTVVLPGNVGTVSLPTSYGAELENEETLLAAPDDSNVIVLRFSCISITSRDGGDADVESVVRDKAREKGLDYRRYGAHGVSTYQQESEEDGVPLVVRFWELGSKGTVVILSATIDRDSQRSSVVRKTLDAIPGILESVTITKSHRVVRSGDDEVEVTEQVVEPAPQEIRPFAAAEAAWLRDGLAQARALSLKYGSGGELDPPELDRIFSRWLNDEEEKEPDDEMANALGAAFGNYFVEQHGFRWIVVTDEYGTEVAVRHARGETTGFPRASVAKRIEDRQPEFFQNLSIVLIDHVANSDSPPGT